MLDIVEIDKKLSNSLGLDSKYDFDSIWSSIKDDTEILKQAIAVKDNQFKYKYIVEAMLYNFEEVDIDIYNELIELIYSNEKIARTEVYNNSLLKMSLYNVNLELSDSKKVFAVKEAMQFPGTILNCNYDGVSINVDKYDIRYYILRNNSWDYFEKAELVNDFYSDYKYFDQVLSSWEEGIIDNPINRGYKIDKKCLYLYTYDILVKLFQDKDQARTVYNDIIFCKFMRELRSDVIPIKQKQVTFI